MEKQYVVTLSRGDGCQEEEIWGPTCLEDCDSFVTGWLSGYSELGITQTCYEITIKEVQA